MLDFRLLGATASVLTRRVVTLHGSTSLYREVEREGVVDSL